MHVAVAMTVKMGRSNAGSKALGNLRVPLPFDLRQVYTPWNEELEKGLETGRKASVRAAKRGNITGIRDRLIFVQTEVDTDAELPS